MELKEFIGFMDETDDREAAADLLAAVQKEGEAGVQVVLDCLKEGKYLRSTLWLAQALELKQAVPFIESLKNERFQEHKNAALQILKD